MTARGEDDASEALDAKAGMDESTLGMKMLTVRA